MRHQPDIVGKLRRALRDTAQRGQYVEIHLARIRLSGNTNTCVEIHLARDTAFKLLDLFRITAEQLHKARAGAGRPLASQQLQIGKLELDLRKIAHEVLQPQCGALADGRRLRSLEMRIRKRRQSLMLRGKGGDRLDCAQQQLAHTQKSLAHHDDVGIVADIT